MKLFDKVYEDFDGVQYKLIEFKDNQFKLKVVDSPYDTIKEGVTEKMNELPEVELDS